MRYEKPEWEVIKMEAHDIIMTSVTEGGIIPDEDTGETPFIPGSKKESF